MDASSDIIGKDRSFGSIVENIPEPGISPISRSGVSGYGQTGDNRTGCTSVDGEPAVLVVGELRVQELYIAGNLICIRFNVESALRRVSDGVRKDGIFHHYSAPVYYRHSLPAIAGGDNRAKSDILRVTAHIETVSPHIF
jgi:hypothetical protein